jgi:hypothetical protein
MKRKALILCACLISLGLVADAQRLTFRFRVRPPTPSDASNPIAAGRLPGNDATLPNPTWADAGAGTIPTNRTECVTAACNTVASAGTSATAAQINSAIASMSSGEKLTLAAGTYTLSAKLDIRVSNVTLTGQGPDSTFLVFTSGSTCTGAGSSTICVFPSNYTYVNGSSWDSGTSLNWTANYSQGTTTLVLADKTNIGVGDLLYLEQNEDGTTDPGVTQPWRCREHLNVCSQTGSGGGSGGPERDGRALHQLVMVTSVEGGSCAPTCDIGIDPPILAPDWRSGQDPEATVKNTGGPVSGVGIENLSIETTTAANVGFHITFWDAAYSWVKNVRSLYPDDGDVAISHHIFCQQTLGLTVRDSYFFNNTANESESGGMNATWCANPLVENNIFQSVTNPVYAQAMDGAVIAYNYSINHLYGTGDWMLQGMMSHGNSQSFNLFEGNDNNGHGIDNWFGASQFYTYFRNRGAGWENQPGGLDDMTVAVLIQANARYINVLGGVYGWNAHHTKYEVDDNDNPATDCVHAVFSIGLGDNCEDGGVSPFPPDDSLTRTTLFRWGNYDTVNDATRWESSEVPSGIAAFSNPVPSSQTLPNSLYLSAEPSFFGSVPYPAIGPDVTGGSEANVGGHNAKIPARRCFEDVMGGAFGDTSAKTFNANSCYPVP